MANKVYNSTSKKWSLLTGSDAVGPYIQWENGIKEYSLIIGITTGVTATTAVVGSYAKTSHATGRGKIFTSVGGFWTDTNS